MKRTYIKDVKVGEVNKVQGFLENIRDKKTMAFLVVKDITGKLQLTIEKEKCPEIAEAIARSGETGWLADLLQNPATLPIFFAVLGGIIIWSFIHSAFVKPFVLTGVLRNYIESGKNDIPSDASMNELSEKSPKFKKFRNSAI